ncbi:MAG: hypothetical protein K2Y32_15000 [Candidatus Obscuribacterales bacterium]|nr:hypothetical protein [Candidatus Obscuribacterales bacterium]
MQNLQKRNGDITLRLEGRERRERVALDEAYEFYKQLLSQGATENLHSLVNALKTVSTALEAAERGELEITVRLWRKIRQALFDQLLTGFSSHVVVVTSDGRVLAEKEDLPDDSTLELYPEGLKRSDDFFTASLEDLHPHTRSLLDRVWRTRGASIRKEDFQLGEKAAPQGEQEELGESCKDGVCALRPNSFVVGAELLSAEAKNGREKAYQEYWRLYWQSYCSPRAREKQYLVRQMASLEAVWGNLHY